jgi:hypothetical protein
MMTEFKRKMLKPDQIDNLAMAMIELAKELWVVKDRQMVTESLLQDKGLLGALDNYQPSEELTARLKVERERMLSGFMALLLDDGKTNGH